MTNQDIGDGGPAFPCQHQGSTRTDAAGMSLRDHFAGLALAAMIGHENKDGWNRGKSAVPVLAGYAYEYADAMLRARKVAP